MNNTPDRDANTANPPYHQSGVRWVRTIEVILSVIEPNVCPGAMTARSPAPAVRACASSAVRWGIATLFTEVWVEVADRGQIGRPRPGVELREQRVVALFGLQLGDPALLVVQIAEDDRVGRARLLTGGLDLPILDFPIRLLTLDLRL